MLIPSKKEATFRIYLSQKRHNKFLSKWGEIFKKYEILQNKNMVNFTSRNGKFFLLNDDYTYDIISEEVL